jgi:hypothetical protein
LGYLARYFSNAETIETVDSVFIKAGETGNFLLKFSDAIFFCGFRKTRLKALNRE